MNKLSTLGLWFCLSIPASAAVTVSLSANAASPSPVGVALHWTAVSTGADPFAEYRWSVTKPNGITSIVVDFDASAGFDYMPLQDGTYTVTVTAKNSNTSELAAASVSYMASSLQSDPSTPVATATANPLVAIYSAACATGSMRVFFAPAGTNPILNGMGTASQACVAGHSVNFIVAGMRANTLYTIQHQVAVGFTLQNGPLTSFTTGAAPSLPPAIVSGSTAAPEKIVLFSFIGLHGIQGTAAYDTAGNPVWMNDPSRTGNPTLFRPAPGGTFMASANPTNYAVEFDLLSNVVRKTSAARLMEQVGISYPKIGDFNHDMLRLPNGYTAFVVGVEQLFTDGTQGSSLLNPIDLQGEGIVVVDQNWQVVWTWNPYAKFDVTRPPVFPAPCPGLGCDPITLALTAVDWMHGNSLLYTADNNFVMSLRNQDLLIKINYANGAGNGDILWRLGAGGDFTITNPNIDGFPWFSGQHSPTYKGNYLTLVDNGTTRVTPGVSYNFDPNLCCSRGQAWTIDEAHKTATLVTNASLGTFSDIIGTSQQLQNGNLHFLSGFANGGFLGEIKEFTPAGTPVYTFDIPNSTYRAFRLRDLYTP